MKLELDIRNYLTQGVKYAIHNAEIYERGEYFLVEVKKKDGESFDSLLRRFNRKIQQSGVLVRARRIRFFAPARSRNLLRQDALRRTINREKREELKKQGKLPMTPKFKRR